MPDLLPWTRELVLALPDDGNRYELLDGELLVTPAPRPGHQLVAMALARALDGHVRAERIGTVLTSPADLFGRAGQLLQPDLFVVPARGSADRWDTWPDPLLVVEILSPASARRDRGAKRRFYQRAGVAEYWIVDPDARLVERWRPGDERPEILDAELRWEARAGVPPLLLHLPTLFAEALDA